MAGERVVVVTGARGFLGQHLIARLGHRPDLDVIHYDGRLSARLLPFLQGLGTVDAIVHLAGRFLGDYDVLARDNVLATQLVCSAAVSAKVPRLVFSSSGAVYGASETREASESDATKPDTLYGLTKLQAEAVVAFYGSKALSSCCLRLPSIYGPGGRGVVSAFINDATSKGVVTLHGGGKDERQFLRVEDACTALERALDASATGSINIPGRTVSTVAGVAQSLRQAGLHFEMRHADRREGAHSLRLRSDRAAKDLHIQWQAMPLNFEGML